MVYRELAMCWWGRTARTRTKEARSDAPDRDAARGDTATRKSEWEWEWEWDRSRVG